MVDEQDVEADTDLQNDESIADEPEEESPLFDESTPPRDRKLQTNPFDFIVSSINSQIEDGSIVLQDEFQRRRVWNDVKASRLIESLILNVPIPVCYFAEIEDGAYAVVDGQQRLTSIYRYLDNQFSLRGLKVRPDLNRKRFHQLPPADQRLIRARTIRCIVILKESHPDIRFDVFERLNTATVSLNRQELRNSTYRGNLNKLIVELCKNETFLRIRNAETPDKRMRDAELILRFLAFHFGGSEFRSGFTRHLDKYLDSGRKFDEATIASHREAFDETILKAYSVFADDAFRRVDADGTPENQINSAVFDAIMLTFARLDRAVLVTDIIEAVDAGAQTPASIPEAIRVRQVLGDAARWTNADQARRWQMMRQCAASPLFADDTAHTPGVLDAGLHTEGFANPGTGAIKDLFKTVGLIDCWSAFHEIEPQHAFKNEIDAIVARRNQIAHGDMNAAVTDIDVITYSNNFRRTAAVFEQLAQRHVAQHVPDFAW
ncbi:GmrSD restriction endonuclease domain-containing protein [Phenylobacterium sp. VNQ135]|uniref:GmrSD restriction endonuclease domain-containing protein n=1 Tax=Phenylobacterium sp. VNQ135 TaxID=3400922 RepID=UPI003C0344F5